jgi:hypothetical protein
MAEEFLGERKRLLEEEFFKRQEKALLERMHAAQAQQARRDALAQAAGITDAAVLDRLLALDIDADTLLAMRLVPVVVVAWADGALDPGERRAITASLGSVGLAPDSPAAQMVTYWLQSPPPPALLDAWQAYIAGLCAQLSASERESLRTSVLGQARTVAEAAGGFLGLGSKVSQTEEAILQTLARAFTG